MKNMYILVLACLMVAGVQNISAQVRLTEIKSIHNGKQNDRGVLTYNSDGSLKKYEVYGVDNNGMEVTIPDVAEYTFGADEVVIKTKTYSWAGDLAETVEDRILRDRTKPGWIAKSWTSITKENDGTESRTETTFLHDAQNRLISISVSEGEESGKYSFTRNEAGDVTMSVMEVGMNDRQIVVTTEYEYTDIVSNSEIVSAMVYIIPLDPAHISNGNITTMLNVFLLNGKRPKHYPSTLNMTYSKKTDAGNVDFKVCRVDFSYEMDNSYGLRMDRVTITSKEEGIEDGEEISETNTNVLEFKYTDFSTGVNDVQVDDMTSAVWYSVSGVPSSNPHSGLNIRKGSDGSVRKVIVR